MSTDQIRGGPIRGGRVDLRTFLDGAVAAIEDGDIAWAIIDAAWFRGREPTLDQWGSWGDARYAAADLLAALLAGDKDAIVEHAEAVGLLLELEDRAAAHIGPGAQAGEAAAFAFRQYLRLIADTPDVDADPSEDRRDRLVDFLEAGCLAPLPGDLPVTIGPWTDVDREAVTGALYESMACIDSIMARYPGVDPDTAEALYQAGEGDPADLSDEHREKVRRQARMLVAACDRRAEG